MQNGSTIQHCNREGTGAAVHIQSNGKFYMFGGTIQNNIGGTAGVVQVMGGGTFYMAGGTLRNNTGTLNGGVNISTDSNFVMSGGTISNNTATGTAISGGAVRLTTATSSFTMHGGTISGNRQTNTANQWGAGGVQMANGNFVMIGGSITNNNSAFGSGAGGVQITHGNFTMSGSAVISGNVATEAWGTGGVVLAGSNANFIMNGGTIGGNSSTAANSGSVAGGVRIVAGTMTINGGAISHNNGAGILVSVGGNVNLFASLRMNGGMISNNTGFNGAGVRLVNGSTFTMSGGSISNNTATNRGGGLSIEAADALFTMNNATARIESNSARIGGGIYQPNGTANISSGIINGNVAEFHGGGVRVSTSVTSAFTMTGGSITNNIAQSSLPSYGGGGGISTNLASSAIVVPVTAYRNLNIGNAVVFHGNTSGLGASAPPDNTLPHIASASTSIWDYVLNNYDILYTVRLGEHPDAVAITISEEPRDDNNDVWNDEPEKVYYDDLYYFDNVMPEVSESVCVEIVMPPAAMPEESEDFKQEEQSAESENEDTEEY